MDIRAAIEARLAQSRSIQQTAPPAAAERKLILPPSVVTPEVLPAAPAISVPKRGRPRIPIVDPNKPGLFDVVLMDPPWWYAARLRGEGRSKFGEGASGKYDCMTDMELMQLHDLIRAIVAPQAVVFMWTTGPRLDFAMDLGRMWGFRYSTKAFSWYKTTIDGNGMRGLPGTYTASNTEDVLLFTHNARKYGEFSNKYTPKTAGGRLMVPQTVWEWAEDGDEPLFVEAPEQAPEWWNAEVDGPFLVEAPNGATTAWAEGTVALRYPLMEHSRKPDDVHERINEMYPNARKIELFARREYPGWACLGNEIDGLDIRDALALAATGYYDLERGEYVA